MNTNPWLGWSSYEETSAAQGNLFVGRSKEIGELFSLIDNNLLVTLYGKSGIGKTSILKAGLFSPLLAAGYCPIVCRCDGGGDYPDFIIRQIKLNCKIEPSGDSNSYLSLIDFFQECNFFHEESTIFPVLFFDQFEDWFRLGPGFVEKLLSDISFLISSAYEGVTNFRFVISIREDYLYLLEDAIGNASLSELKQNRYRLTELNEYQAEEILDLGKIAAPVRTRLLAISKTVAGYHPGLLSFYCHELYNQYPTGIPEEALTLLDDEANLISSYYDNCFKQNGISEKTKRYIEENLQEEGMRHPLHLDVIKRNISPKELTHLLDGQYKLLQKFPVGNEEHVELMHDKLAELINRKRADGVEKQRRVLLTTFFSFYMPAVAYVLWKIALVWNHIKLDLDLPSLEDTDILFFGAALSLTILVYYLVYQLPEGICRYVYFGQTWLSILPHLVIPGISGIYLYLYQLESSNVKGNLLIWFLFCGLCLSLLYIVLNSLIKHDQ